MEAYGCDQKDGNPCENRYKHTWVQIENDDLLVSFSFSNLTSYWNCLMALFKYHNYLTLNTIEYTFIFNYQMSLWTWCLFINYNDVLLRKNGINCL